MQETLVSFDSEKQRRWVYCDFLKVAGMKLKVCVYIAWFGSMNYISLIVPNLQLPRLLYSATATLPQKKDKGWMLNSIQ